MKKNRLQLFARSVLLATVIAGTIADAYAQITTYTLTNGTSTYVPLTGGTSLAANGDLTAGTSDDGYKTITLPFTFTYDGAPFTMAQISTNGFVGLGTQSYNVGSWRAAGNAFIPTVPNNTLAAWFADGNANFGTGGGTMVYGAGAVTGTYVFEWKNASGNGYSTSTTNKITFQIVLHGPASGTPGVIEYHYGTATASPSTSRSIAIEDATGGTNHYINAINGLSNNTTTASSWPGTNKFYIFSPPAPCSGTPTGGTVSSSANNTCPAISVTFSVTGATAASGITYQWQSSTNNINFADISGATAASYTAVPVNGTYYRRATICMGTPGYSTSILQTTSFAFSCYCTAAAFFNTDEEIRNVTLGGLNNSSNCSSLVGSQGTATGSASLYSNFTNAVFPPALSRGSTYPLSVTLAECDGFNYARECKAYFDWNQNGVWTDPGEEVLVYALNDPGNLNFVATVNVSIPSGATLGTTYMRLILASEQNVSGPCLSPDFGEVEDYKITIAPACLTTTTVTPTVSNNGPICANTTAQLTATGLAPGGQTATYNGAQTFASSGITTLANTFTMEFWVNPSSTRASTPVSNTGISGTTAQRYAIYPAQSGTNSGAGISVGTNGISVFEHGNSYLPSFIVYDASITGWTHVAVVYTAKAPKLYVNGILVASGPTSLVPSVYPSIGTGGNGSYGDFTGGLDNIRIWNGALSATEIAGVANSETLTTIGSKSAVAHYRFNGGNFASSVTGVPAWSTPTTNPNANFYTYTWTGTGAPVAGTSETATTASLSTSQSYTVVASTSCQTLPASAATTVTVNSPAVMLAAASTQLCPSSGTTSTTLTASGANSYVFMPGGATTNPLTVSPSATTTYIVTGTDANGCTNTASVTVNVGPTLGVVPTATPSTICAGSTSQLNAAASGSGPGFNLANLTYAWTPSATLSNAAIANPVATPVATTTYNVTATDPASGCTAMGTVDVTVTQLPAFSACPTNQSNLFCTGGGAATTYTATANAPITYTFSGATTGSGAGTGSGETFNNGVTTVTLTAANGCAPNATCSFTVTTGDVTAPTINACNPAITVANDACSCYPMLATIATPVTLNYADRLITYTNVSINQCSNAVQVLPRGQCYPGL